MSSINELFTVSEFFNRVKEHNINFKVTQSIRIFMFLVSLANWTLLLYVWSKAILGQIVFYTLTIWIYALTTLAISAGREVVEVKILEKLKAKKRDEPNANLEAIDEMELPTEDKSKMWKIAVTAYTLAAPFVFSVPIMFGLFWHNMIKGEVCEFFSLSTPSQDSPYYNMNGSELQTECLNHYDDSPEMKAVFKDGAGFRYTGLLMAIFVPPFVLLVEFALNQVLIPKRQFYTPIITNLVYMIVTMAYTSNNLLFPGLVAFNCTEEGCKWSQFFFWHFVFIGVTQGCFWLMVAMHYFKVKFCCRKSVSIVHQPLFAESQVSITAKQR